MNEDSLKKFNRIIAILVQLQSRKIVKATDLADRFEVSIRTIYRDIQSLEKAGVPIIGEPGLGYTIMDGYRLPPVMFNREEAMSFVTAEKLMQKLSDKSIGKHYESAMAKIKSVLRTSEKEMISDVSSSIDVRSKQSLFNNNIPNALELVLESIVQKKQVIIQYQAFSEELTQRTLEAVGVFYEYHYWYILGYCLLRKDYRQFRTDRIVSIQASDVPFSQAHGSLSDYKPSYSTAPKTEVVLLVDFKIAKYIAQSKLHYGFVSERSTEEGIEMTFRTADIKDGFPRWILMFADKITIVSPELLKTYTRSLLEQISNRLN
ncbi:transcriptional regulator [Taibaiella sp. KBW10]|uniref:helix-turn-helix transcriptional regulator n=1 Tax=Taibaiella sp. KBW10 TaxID=2153357 RepID=UPI000F5ABA36|nr:YafY family protein [Taibaiella sp. KBW10]RQO32346.1 transcriptional regulator [Taibaiella sp. KBW10]